MWSKAQKAHNNVGKIQTVVAGNVGGRQQEGGVGGVVL